jgi:membrane protease YdiL (CAAX protease family)
VPLTVGAVSLAAVFLARDPELRAALRPNARSVGAGVLLGAAMIGVTYLCYPLLARAWPGFADDTRAIYALLRPERYGRAALAGLLALTAASEEVIFRGRLLPKTGAPWYRCLISSLVYAVGHLTSGSWLLVAVAFGCGCFWAAVRLQTRSLVAGIVVHVAWDLCVLVFFPLS